METSIPFKKQFLENKNIFLLESQLNKSSAVCQINKFYLRNIFHNNVLVTECLNKIYTYKHKTLKLNFMDNLSFKTNTFESTWKWKLRN